MYPLQTRIHWLLPFPSVTARLTAWVQTSSTILNMNGECRYLCLVCALSRNPPFSPPFRMILTVGLPYIAFIILRYGPCIPQFFVTFSMKRCWILSKAFSTSKEIDDHVFFVLEYVNVKHYIYWFIYVEPLLFLLAKGNLIMVGDFCSDVVCKDFIENFCIYIHQRYCIIFFFLFLHLYLLSFLYFMLEFKKY